MTAVTAETDERTIETDGTCTVETIIDHEMIETRVVYYNCVTDNRLIYYNRVMVISYL